MGLIFGDNVLLARAEGYLKRNEERFNAEEKAKFRRDLYEYLTTEGGPIADEVYDFLLSNKLIKSPTRHEEFANYIRAKHPVIANKRVLDVGAGRMAHLSQELAKFGYETTAMDPNLRITKKEARQMGIKNIAMHNFVCDKYATNGIGSDATNYDLIVGLEPCMATEHILLQTLKYADKAEGPQACEVVLCYQNHDALDGTKFDTPEAWYEHLASLSNEIKINNTEMGSVASIG